MPRMVDGPLGGDGGGRRAPPPKWRRRPVVSADVDMMIGRLQYISAEYRWESIGADAYS